MNYCGLVAGMLLTVCCFTEGFTQKVDSTKMYFIDEVTVSAQQIRKDIIPVQTLAGEELQKLSVHSVADAIRYFSGVQI